MSIGGFTLFLVKKIIFHAFEAGIVNTISSLKWQKKILFTAA